jgi:PTH1 family peptidyl-tRNA hydrolase
MKLVAGLGNPGPEYALTPHNIGFRVVDMAAEMSSAAWRNESKFMGGVARTRFGGVDALLLKPSTYMNLSGEAVSRTARYFGVLPADLVVVSDDADLPVGRLRVRARGGSGGHRGLQSIIDCLGTDAFTRVRIGIGRSAFGGSLADYVLGRPPKEDEEALERAVPAAVEAVKCVLTLGAEEAMNRFNAAPAAEAVAQQEEQRG